MIDLSKLHPDLVAKVGRVLEQMQLHYHPMRITDGYRTVAQQKALFAKGRTAPGRIVTHCDGVRTPSNHQSGRAVDCCFLGPDPYGDNNPWEQYGQFAEAEGLIWGGRWRAKKRDRPHVELPPALPKGTLVA